MRPWKLAAGTVGTGLLLAAGFSASAPFAAAWHARIALPFASLAASVSERLPFPLLEPLALILLVWAAAGFLQGFRRGLSRLCAMLCALLAVYVLAWLPGYFVPMERILPTESTFLPAQSDPKALEALCQELIGGLSTSQFRFTGGEGALKQATEAMNDAFGAELSESAVRFARYPEWMATLELAGFYSPWTGEALVSPRLAAAALPFTACHELAHRLGVADEGSANIAAWIACRRAGGELADSAALWALRYAMTELRAADEAAWRRCAQSMKPPLLRAFTAVNGFAAPTSKAPLSFPGTSSYSALIPWLLAHPDAME